MRFHPVFRSAACQAIAIAGFIAFLLLMGFHLPVPSQPAPAASQSAAVFVSLAKEKDERPVPPKEPVYEPKTPEKPRPSEPERFRPSTAKRKRSPNTPRMPSKPVRRASVRQKVVAPRPDLPLSYLMKFRSMDEFHAFLEELPQRDRTDRPTMSLIHIEGLPRTVATLRRLLHSYHMEPFLFNPSRFNYLITSDLKVLHDAATIREHIGKLGRYLRGNGKNIAYDEIRREFVKQARSKKSITNVLTDAGEFRRMQLGLASPELARFFRKLEHDTARQLSELLGKPVAVQDISRIDCRFRDVNGVMVLVPLQAYLGTDPEQKPVAIWKES